MSLNKSVQSNYLKKCLGCTFVVCTAIVILIIGYLENTPKAGLHPLVYNQLLVGEERLLNLEDFRYVLGKDNMCAREGKDLFAVVIVTSYAGDVETRSAVRRSHGAKLLAKFRLKRVFLLALIDSNKNTNRVSQEAIVDENNRFHDIIQGSFIEDYHNLTYKHMMGLQWAAQFCSQAKYVIKMDHDIIFDYYKLNAMIKPLARYGKQLLAGYVMNNMKPIREPANKWFVSTQEFKPNAYPAFLSGWLYITTPTTAALLSKASLQEPYFWIDDVFVTGLLNEKLNVTLVKLNKYYTTHPEYLQCCVNKPRLDCDYVIGPSGGNNSLMLAFQKYSESCFYRQCKKRSELNSLHNTCIAKWKEEPFGKGKPYVSLVKIGKH